MTRSEMLSCAAETLSYFIQTMPDVPFGEDDIIIEFTKKSDMAKQAKNLCAMYVPDKKISDTHAEQLNYLIGANALIGREKSAVLVRIDRVLNRKSLRTIIFHELMHIFCAKSEMDGKHFIDIYGSGHTPDMNPQDKEYDGYLNAGYVVWTEFIAHYYALKKTEDKQYSFIDIMDYVFLLLNEVNISADTHDSKTSFAMACAYLMTCDDGNILSDLVAPDDMDSKEKETELVLRGCLEHINSNLQNEKPWKINENFISELGKKFLTYKIMNSFSHGAFDR